MLNYEKVYNDLLHTHDVASLRDHFRDVSRKTYWTLNRLDDPKENSVEFTQSQCGGHDVTNVSFYVDPDRNAMAGNKWTFFCYSRCTSGDSWLLHPSPDPGVNLLDAISILKNNLGKTVSARKYKVGTLINGVSVSRWLAVLQEYVRNDPEIKRNRVRQTRRITSQIRKFLQSEECEDLLSTWNNLS